MPHDDRGHHFFIADGVHPRMHQATQLVTHSKRERLNVLLRIEPTEDL
jgi:hypothetical protein